MGPAVAEISSRDGRGDPFGGPAGNRRRLCGSLPAVPGPAPLPCRGAGDRASWPDRHLKQRPHVPVAASIDPLTQVANRGTFDAMLGRWVESCQQTRQPFVLVLIDVDHFKQINDTHGHPAGDRALIGAAGVLKQSVRPCDLVARYGGDEFALLLANMTLAQAEKRLAEIVARLAGRELRDEPSGAAPIRVTISCGMVQFER